MDDRDWGRLVDQLKNGACTPLLGAGAMPGAAGATRQETGAPPSLLDAFAPTPDAATDPAAAGPAPGAPIRRRDPAFVRQQMADEILSVPAPDFEARTEPHALLARLPLPVYLTTNFDGFLTEALLHHGKHPRSAICPWNRGAEAVGSRDTDAAHLRFPTSREPVVYHLHGSARHPRSMVVTEDDHMDFALGLGGERGNDRRLIPTQLRPALTTRPLLFLGYDIRDWSVRLLFRGLLRTVAAMEPRRRAVMQLPPPRANGDPDQVAEKQRQVSGYYQQWNIAIFWGDLPEFCAALDARLEWT